MYAAILQWNALPEEVVSSPSLDIFMATVGKLQHSKPYWPRSQVLTVFNLLLAILNPGPAGPVSIRFHYACLCGGPYNTL